MLNELQAFILGLIQGLTEFLPISSTGHLYLGRHLFHLDEAGIYLDTMLHIGTLLALLVVYKGELGHLIKKPFSKLTALLVVGTIPAVAAGLLLSDWFDELSKTGVTIGWEFLATGFILWMADNSRRGTKNPRRNFPSRCLYYWKLPSLCHHARPLSFRLNDSGRSIM